MRPQHYGWEIFPQQKSRWLAHVKTLAHWVLSTVLPHETGAEHHKSYAAHAFSYRGNT